MTEGQDQNVNPVPAEIEPVVESEEARAAFEKRRKGKRAQNFPPVSLGITSLMDAMTIIMVYMLMNFAADPSTITQTEALKLTQSVAIKMLDKVTTIAVTQKNIVVADRPVVPVRDGQVDPSEKRDGARGFYITRLGNLLTEKMEEEQKINERLGHRFEGKLNVVVDRTIPFSLLTEVLYTAGQSGYGMFNFAVISGE